MLVPFKPNRSSSQAPLRTNSNQLSKYSPKGPDRERGHRDLGNAIAPFEGMFEGRSGFGNIFKEFNQISKRMFDDFDSDFFGGGSSLFKRMNKQMERMFQGFDDDFDDRAALGSMRGGMGEGTVVRRTYVGSTKIDENGRRVEEKYFSNDVTQKKNGNTISDRKQAYKNTANGLEKIAHERRLNDQGRKFTKERIRDAGEEYTHNIYHNIDEHESQEFDRRWNDESRKMGFLQKNSGALLDTELVRNQNYNQRDYTGKKKKADRNPESLLALEDGNFRSDVRRGDYIPYQKKLQNQPVRVNHDGNYQDPYFPRQTAADLMPSYGGGGVAVGTNATNQTPTRMQAGAQLRPTGGNPAVGAGVYRNRGSMKNDIPKAG